MRRLLAVANILLGLLVPLRSSAQRVERVELHGPAVAIYNLAGSVRVDGGAVDRVVVEVIRGGQDARRLVLDTGMIRGRMTLRVRYPSDRLTYADGGWTGNTTVEVDRDGTFADDMSDRNGGDASGVRDTIGPTDRRVAPRRVEITSRARGTGVPLDAYADLHVIVPRGIALSVQQGVGSVTVESVEGTLAVSVRAARVRASHVRGALTLDSDAGDSDVADLTGDLTVASDTGSLTTHDVRGGAMRLTLDVGRLRASGIDVTELTATVRAGSVRFSTTRATRLRLQTDHAPSEISLLVAPGDASIEAGSGRVTLALPTNTGSIVDIETRTGKIASDFTVARPLAGPRLTPGADSRTLRGTIGVGGGRIRIRTHSGDVRLVRRREVPF